MVSAISRIGSEIIAVTSDIGKTLQKRGFVRCLNRLYSIKGFEKGANALIPILELLKGFNCTRVTEWLDIIRMQKDLYDSTLVVFATSHKATKKPSFAHALLALGYIVRAGEVLKKYEVVNFGTIKIFNTFEKPSEGIFLVFSLLKLDELRQNYSALPAEKRRHFLDLIFHVGRVALFVLKAFAKEGEARFGFPFFFACQVVEIGTYQTNLIKFIVK